MRSALWRGAMRARAGLLFGPSLALLVLGCGARTAGPTILPSATGHVLVGAGDIASCGSPGDTATARLLDSFPDATIFTAGDNAYHAGSATEYRDCYAPTWGRHKDRTRPSPGNHEYGTPGAAGYFGYFGASAGDSSKGYYSYDIGNWHILSLNSNVPMAAGSPQEQWVRADLAATDRSCILAYWHAPRFSSGPHGDALETEPLWDALYAAHADVVVNGHDHTYERFAPQAPSGQRDSAQGIREFVVGTGGASHYGRPNPQPNSEVFDSTTFGVLRLVLESTSYTWEFVPVAGGTFHDAGAGECHPKARSGR